MYSRHNDRKSVVAERFIRILKTKIYKHVTPISKNVCINKLNEIVDKYNSTYDRTIKLKPSNVESGTYIDVCVKHKDPKFEAGDLLRISRYKNILRRPTHQINLKKPLGLKKSKILCHGQYNDLNSE